MIDCGSFQQIQLYFEKEYFCEGGEYFTHACVEADCDTNSR